MKATKAPARILVIGGGYVGMYAALRLQQKWKTRLEQARWTPDEASAAPPHEPGYPGPAETGGAIEIVVVDPDPYMTYQPFLPEAAAGSISPRHVVVPLRRVLPKCQIVVGEAVAVDHRRRVARIRTLAAAEALADAERRDAEAGNADHSVHMTTGGDTAGSIAGTDRGTVEIGYSELVLAPGSVSRTLPIPGLAEHGIGFKSVEEAIGLRNHVLEQLDIASSTRNPEVRDSALTFVFVGAGFAGVEALGELEDMARYACRYYHNIRPQELKFMLVEATDTILPEVGREMGRYALRELRSRNIDVRMETRIESCEDRVVVLDDGSRHPARTLVWTAGVKPHPVLSAADLPLNGRGRLVCTPELRVDGVDHVWSAGDTAAVPDLIAREKGSPDALCAPNAQHAVRQARRLADNLTAHLRGEATADYRHAYAGSVASLGLHKGVAHVYGRKLKGYPAWFMHRAYHLSRVPTLNRKARVLAEWTLAGLFKREIVSLGSLEHPRAEFEMAAGTGRRPEGN